MRLIDKWLMRDKIVYRVSGMRGVYIVRRIKGRFYVHEVQGAHEVYVTVYSRFAPAMLLANRSAG